MAAIERGSGESDDVVRGWLAKALGASRGPQWICTKCNHVNVTWGPVCENCGAFDTLDWRTPSHAEDARLADSAMLPLIIGGPAAAPEPGPAPAYPASPPKPVGPSGLGDRGRRARERRRPGPGRGRRLSALTRTPANTAVTGRGPPFTRCYEGSAISCPWVGPWRPRGAGIEGGSWAWQHCGRGCRKGRGPSRLGSIRSPCFRTAASTAPTPCSGGRARRRWCW